MNDKKWNLQTIVLYGINSVIGSGIFLLPGSAYDHLGPASLLAIYLCLFWLCLLLFVLRSAAVCLNSPVDISLRETSIWGFLWV